VTLGPDILANAIGSIIATAALHGTKYGGSGARQQRQSETLREEILDRLTASASGLSTALSDAIGGVEDDAWPRTLIESVDFRDFVRLFVASKRAGLAESADRSFSMYLRGVVGLYAPAKQQEEITAALLGGLEEATSQLLDEPRIRERLELDPAAVSASLTARQLDQLLDIAKFWSTHSRDAEDSMLRVLRDHRIAMHGSTARVQPPDFSERRLVPLKDIYVVPRMSGALTSPGALIKRVEALDAGGHVILGDPGAGKTTLVTHLAHTLTTKPDHVRLETVAIVNLREFEQQRETSALSVADYLAARTRDRLQVTSTPEDWDRALRRGLVAVLFDGLDELLQVPRRSEMASIIEAFLGRYPLIPVVVTCRFDGYGEAALARDLFRVSRLHPFDDRQVEEYVRKWFGLEGNSLADRTPAESAEAFMGESSPTSELRSNPLLLSLLCILFRGRGYIPENLSEVYRECTELLFERWDRHRQVRVPRYGDRLRLLVERIAWWMYDERLNERGVTERVLEDRCVIELREIKADDEEAAREVAKEFIAHCKGRAWVFTDAGSSDLRDRRFCFTHRSFMEYFAARRLARVLQRDPSSNALDTLVFDLAGNLVAILSLQVLGVDADDVMERFLNRLERSTAGTRSRAIDFLHQVLRFVDLHDRISARATKVIVGASMDDSITLFDAQRHLVVLDDEHLDAVGEAIRRLGEARSENWPAIQRSLKDQFVTAIPRRLEASWDSYPLLALNAACTSSFPLTTDRDEALRKVLQEAQSLLGERLLSKRRFSEIHTGAAVLAVLPRGVLGSKWAPELLATRLGTRGESPLEIVLRCMFAEQRFSASCGIAAALLDECFEGQAPLKIGADEAWDVLFDVQDTEQPHLAFGLAGEDYRFEIIPDSFIGQLLIFLFALSERLRHPTRRYLAAAAFIALCRDGDPDHAYLRATERRYDPIADATSRCPRSALIAKARALTSRIEIDGAVERYTQR